MSQELQRLPTYTGKRGCQGSEIQADAQQPVRGKTVIRAKIQCVPVSWRSDFYHCLNLKQNHCSLSQVSFYRSDDEYWMDLLPFRFPHLILEIDHDGFFFLEDTWILIDGSVCFRLEYDRGKARYYKQVIFLPWHCRPGIFDPILLMPESFHKNKCEIPA